MRSRQIILRMGGSAKKTIYGVSWNKSSSPSLTRTDSAIGMVANVGVDSASAINNFDSAEIYGEITEVTDIYENVFIKIPRFYIEKTSDANSFTWRISKTPFRNSYLPKCFVNNPYIYVGKYDGNRSTDTTKLESKPGTVPLTHVAIGTLRTLATATGTGYQLLDIHMLDVLQTLFVVEFATLNSQSIVAGATNLFRNNALTTVAETAVNRCIMSNSSAGNFVIGQYIIGGSTNYTGTETFTRRKVLSIDTYDASNKAITFDGDPVDIAVGVKINSDTQLSGACDSIVASTGSVSSNSDGKHSFKYRGIENLFGNVAQMIDGLNIYNNVGWVCENPVNYVSNVHTSPYIQIGYTNANSDGSIKYLGFDSNYPYVNLPIDVSGTNTTYYCDNYVQDTSDRIAVWGGTYEGGSTSHGLFRWEMNRNYTYTSSYGWGSRLAYVGDIQTVQDIPGYQGNWYTAP